MANEVKEKGSEPTVFGAAFEAGAGVFGDVSERMQSLPRPDLQEMPVISVPEGMPSLSERLPTLVVPEGLPSMPESFVPGGASKRMASLERPSMPDVLSGMPTVSMSDLEGGAEEAEKAMVEAGRNAAAMVPRIGVHELGEGAEAAEKAMLEAAEQAAVMMTDATSMFSSAFAAAVSATAGGAVQERESENAKIASGSNGYSAEGTDDSSKTSSSKAKKAPKGNENIDLVNAADGLNDNERANVVKKFMEAAKVSKTRDKAGNPTLNKSAFKVLVKNIISRSGFKAPPKPSDLNTAFDEADTDKSGTVSAAKFICYIGACKSKHAKGLGKDFVEATVATSVVTSSPKKDDAEMVAEDAKTENVETPSEEVVKVEVHSVVPAEVPSEEVAASAVSS